MVVMMDDSVLLCAVRCCWRGALLLWPACAGDARRLWAGWLPLFDGAARRGYQARRRRRWCGGRGRRGRRRRCGRPVLHGGAVLLQAIGAVDLLAVAVVVAALARRPCRRWWWCGWLLAVAGVSACCGWLMLCSACVCAVVPVVGRGREEYVFTNIIMASIYICKKEEWLFFVVLYSVCAVCVCCVILSSII